MSILNDFVFGEMEYKHGWIKKERIMLWGSVRNIKIKATAYTGDGISQAQRNSYKQFIENIAAISERSISLMADYLKKNYQRGDYQSVKDLVTPRSVLFKKDGSYGILCDFTLDEEHGLVIIIAPKEEVGMQDIFI